MPTAEPGVPQMVRPNIARQHRETSQVRLQAGGAGTAISQDERLDRKIEDIEGDLQHAHVRIDPDDRDALDPFRF
jgi:hypothetical protein